MDGAHVLVVEDDETLRFVLSEHLRLAGYTVSVAEHADRAIEIFAGAEPIDVIVTDIMMPGRMSGIALVQKLRETDPALPSVFMSGYLPEMTDAADAGWLNAIHLMKPVRRDDLIEAIKKALQQDA